jgi:hypothetical protein
LRSCFFNVVRRLKVPSPFNFFCVQCRDGERAYSNAAPRSLVSASACARCLYLDVFLRRAVAVGAAGPSHLHSRACGAHVFWFGEPFPLGHLLLGECEWITRYPDRASGSWHQVWALRLPDYPKIVIWVCTNGIVDRFFMRKHR